ncbi:hypothetical protein LINGRAHAP2_LOCUS17583 [Linum grandiflorum]
MTINYGLVFGVYRYNQNCVSFFGKSFMAFYPLLMLCNPASLRFLLFALFAMTQLNRFSIYFSPAL